MRKLLSVLGTLLMAASAMAAVNLYADVAPNVGPMASYPPSTDAQWDILADWDVETAVTDFQCVGVEYVNDILWVTAGNSGLTVNNLYKYSVSGLTITFVDSFPQPTTSIWGWRDLAYDGTYMYAGDDNTTIHAINPATGALVPGMNIPRPAGLACTRALAYDPVSDSFWSGNFAANMVNFTRTGSIIWQGAPPAGWSAVYGMTWDAVSPGGPFLWIHDQTGTPQTTLRQYNPVTHAATGLNHQVPMLSGLTAQIAGGLTMTSQWNETHHTFIGLVQGTPPLPATSLDKVFVMEYLPAGGLPDISISMVPVTSPVIVPQGGSFDWNGTVTNNELTSQTFDVWIMVTLPGGGQYGPVINVTLTLSPSASLTRLRTQAVPLSAPPGDYVYTGNTGDYPGTVYASDSFPFTVTTDDNIGGSWAGEWSNSGQSFETSASATPAEFSLLGNYPNPFNPTTTINYAIGNADNVKLSVYDLSGRLVSTLVDGYRNAGNYSVTFDASALASGVYVYRLTSGSQTASAKMILSK
jgi:hypothetical protein